MGHLTGIKPTPCAYSYLRLAIVVYRKIIIFWQSRAVQTCAAQIRTAQIRTAQIRIDQMRIAQIRIAQIRIAQYKNFAKIASLYKFFRTSPYRSGKSVSFYMLLELIFLACERSFLLNEDIMCFFARIALVALLNERERQCKVYFVLPRIKHNTFYIILYADNILAKRKSQLA